MATVTAGEVPAFGFPDEHRAEPPSRLWRRTERDLSRAALLTGGLVMSLSLSVLQSVYLLGSAEIIPYVADGGISGCRVPVFDSPPRGRS